MSAAGRGTKLRNLGPRSTAWLVAAGLHTRADIDRIGPAAAYLLVKRRQPRASLNLLWALAALLQDRDWRNLSAAEKRALRGAVTLLAAESAPREAAGASSPRRREPQHKRSQ